MKSMKKRNKMKRKKRTEKVQLSNSILIFLGFIVLLALLWKVGYFSEITGASIGLGIENETALESEIAISLPVEEPIIEIPEVNETLNKTFPDTALPNTDNSPYVSNESNGQITLPIESPIIDVPISINESLDDNITDPLISSPINRTITNRTVFNPIINTTRLNQSITSPNETNQSQLILRNIGLSSLGPFQNCNAVGSASTNRVACTGANEDATDAVSDACTDGAQAGAPDSVRNIYINLTSATGGDWVNITCEVDAFDTPNEVAALYKNTTSGWVNKMFTAGNPGGVSNQSAAFQIDSDAGQHFVRCWEGYDACIATDTCCSTQFGDNDDLNFSVTAAASAPTVTWVTLDQRNYTLTAYNVSFNASISELNIFNVLFSFDNSSGTNFNATAVNFSGTWQVLYNVSSLAKGTHLVTVFANDSSGNVNMTEQRTFRVINQLPIINSVILNTTDLTLNNSNQNINANVSSTDDDGDSIKHIYNWLINGS